MGTVPVGGLLHEHEHDQHAREHDHEHDQHAATLCGTAAISQSQFTHAQKK